MNLIQKMLLVITALVGSLIIAGAATAVQVLAAPPPNTPVFEGSLGEACKGANLSNANGDCMSAAASKTLGERIQAVVNLLSIIVGIVAVILIIINGMRFITANGDSNSISSARNGVIYALVGLIIAALAQVIVRFVLARF